MWRENAAHKRGLHCRSAQCTNLPFDAVQSVPKTSETHCCIVYSPLILAIALTAVAVAAVAAVVVVVLLPKGRRLCRIWILQKRSSLSVCSSLMVAHNEVLLLSLLRWEHCSSTKLIVLYKQYRYYLVNDQSFETILEWERANLNSYLLLVLHVSHGICTSMGFHFTDKSHSHISSESQMLQKFYEQCMQPIQWRL